MKMAATAGAQIVKPAADAFWGGYDHGAIAEPELSAVILADAHPLDEPEGRTQPGDRLAHVGIDQNRDDR
jgi:hypothetical protein